jgi:hypothetical protein
MGFSEEQINNKEKVKEIDMTLDDLCKMDILAPFTGLKNLTLVHQGISQIEVSLLNFNITL